MIFTVSAFKSLLKKSGLVMNTVPPLSEQLERQWNIFVTSLLARNLHNGLKESDDIFRRFDLFSS